MPRILLVCLCLLAAIPSARAEAPAQRSPYILAIHPYLPQEEIQKRFAPLAKYLGQRIARSVQIRVGRDYQEHINAVGLDAVDIAFMGPAAYVKMVDKYGHKPLLARMETLGKPYLSGVIFTRSDSPLRNIGELAGKHFAFGDAESTMGTQVPQYVLLKAGVRLSQLGHYGHVISHGNVVLGVLSGDFDAGAIKRDVFDDIAPRGLRMLAELPQVSEHVFVARSNLPPAEVKNLREALLQLKTSAEGQKILQSIGKESTGMVSVTNTDYDSLRTILNVLRKEKN